MMPALIVSFMSSSLLLIVFLNNSIDVRKFPGILLAAMLYKVSMFSKRSLAYCAVLAIHLSLDFRD